MNDDPPTKKIEEIYEHLSFVHTAAPFLCMIIILYKMSINTNELYYNFTILDPLDSETSFRF